MQKKYWKLKSKIFKTKKCISIMQSKCADCWMKMSRFVKEQEPKGLLSSLGLKTRLSKVPLFRDIFFWVHKMNEIVNKFLLAGDTFIPELHLKNPDLLIVLMFYLLERKKELKIFCRLEIPILFREMSLIKPVFNMIWLMVNQNI